MKSAATPMPLTKAPRRRGLLFACVLALLMVVLSGIRTYGDFGSAVITTPVFDSVLSQPLLTTRLGWNLLLFLAAVTALHLALAVVCWGLGLLTEAAWPRAQASRRQFILCWFLLFAIAILVTNATLYPRSSLGEPYGWLARVEIAGVRPHHIAWAILVGIIAIAVIRAARQGFPKRWVAAIPALPIAAISLAFVPAVPATRGDPDPKGRPNIVFIGIDSLRPEILRSKDAAEQAPNLSAFVNSATSFNDAMTPLARTFPSWVTLITGKHPHTSGASINLIPRDTVKLGDALPIALTRSGYRSVYATDEVRFANIDTSFGFDQSIAPPIGASDFLIGFIGDTPLSNLFVNSRAGAWLFPYLHANRAAAHTYDPDAFLARISTELPRDKPIYLAIHLTLPHWPYTWRDAHEADAALRVPLSRRYARAVRRVDQQFGALLELLQERGILDNALVAVFSDHGESFGSASETLLTKPTGEPFLDMLRSSVGHGTSVLSPHQYTVALSFRGYGSMADKVATGRQVEFPASLEDVTPTVLEIANVPSMDRRDGVSLAQWLAPAALPATPASMRVRFTETEFDPTGLLDAAGNASTSVLIDAATRYRVDPVTDRLEVRAHWVEALNRQRQFAAVGPTKLLAAVPNLAKTDHSIVLLDRAGGFPRRLTAAPSDQNDPEAALLWRALHERFGKYIGQPLAATATPE